MSLSPSQWRLTLGKLRAFSPKDLSILTHTSRGGRSEKSRFRPFQLARFDIETLRRHDYNGVSRIVGL